MAFLPYMFLFALPAGVAHAVYAEGWSLLGPFVFAFGLIPLLDYWVGVDPRNVSTDQERVRAESPSYKGILWFYVATQWALTIFVMARISWGEMSLVEQVGSALALGLSNGAIGITIAHELIHRSGRIEPFLGRFLLLSVCYSHWATEHVRGHHRRVSTPDDPASAKLGQSFYQFYGPCVKGTFEHAWQLEAERLAKRGRKPWHPDNEVLAWGIAQIAVMLGFVVVFGPMVLVWFGLQAWFGFSLLEIVNYFEHYGLERRLNAQGRYEKVQPQHSWNSSHRVSNWFLIELGRHSDHHAHAGRRYQILRHFDEVPQLPFSYVGMLVVALFPPIWFKIMNPLVEEWHQRQEKLQEPMSITA